MNSATLSHTHKRHRISSGSLTNSAGISLDEGSVPNMEGMDMWLSAGIYLEEGSVPNQTWEIRGEQGRAPLPPCTAGCLAATTSTN